MYLQNKVVGDFLMFFPENLCKAKIFAKKFVLYFVKTK